MHKLYTFTTHKRNIICENCNNWRDILKIKLSEKNMKFYKSHGRLEMSSVYLSYEDLKLLGLTTYINRACAHWRLLQASSNGNQMTNKPSLFSKAITPNCESQSRAKSCLRKSSNINKDQYWELNDKTNKITKKKGHSFRNEKNESMTTIKMRNPTKDGSWK